MSRTTVTALLFLAIAGLGFAAMLWTVMDPGIAYAPGFGLHFTNGQDFLNYWAAPQIAAQDLHVLFAGRGYEQALAELYPHQFAALRWSYPLHALFFCAPFSWLPYVPALLLWSVLGVALFLAAAWQALPPRARTTGCFLLLVAPITLLELLTRQNGFFIGAAALLVLLLLQRGRPIAAGILLGCLTIKPQLFLLWPLILLFTKQWRCIAAATVTTLLLLGASLAVHGIEAWQLFIEQVPAYQWSLLEPEAYAGRRHLYQLMMPGLVPTLRLLAVDETLTLMLQIMLSVTVVLFTLRAFRRELTLGQQAIILASGALLASPYGFNYDLTFLSLAIVIRWAERRRMHLLDYLREGLAYFLPMFIYVMNLSPLPLGPVILALVFFGAVRETWASPLKQASP